MLRRITKVKFDEIKVLIEYQTKENEEQLSWDACKLESMRGRPTDDFIATLQSLLPEAEYICSLPDDYLSNAKVRGVSFSYTQDIMGATITVIKPLKNANSPLVLNTPHLPSKDYSGNNQDAPTLRIECIFLLEALQKEAMLYLDGARKEEANLFSEAG